ncbi:MAG: hypothetical protein AABX70_04545 [Nanoarchaeota archaeon]
MGLRDEAIKIVSGWIATALKEDLLLVKFAYLNMITIELGKRKIVSQDMNERVNGIKDDIMRYLRASRSTGLTARDVERHVKWAQEQINIKLTRLFQDLDTLIPK